MKNQLTNKAPIISVTKDDCEWICQRGSGNGGQKKNKTSSAVICTHKISRAQGYAEDMREQFRNKQIAFRRMAETKEFQAWLRTETLKKMGVLDQIEASVDKAMSPKNLRIEIKENEKWVEVTNDE